MTPAQEEWLLFAFVGCFLTPIVLTLKVKDAACKRLKLKDSFFKKGQHK